MGWHVETDRLRRLEKPARRAYSFAPIRLTFGGGPTYETVGICLLGAIHTLRLRDMANHHACATRQIIDFPPTLPMTIVDECAFAFLLRRFY